MGMAPREDVIRRRRHRVWGCWECLQVPTGDRGPGARSLYGTISSEKDALVPYLGDLLESVWLSSVY